MDIQIFCQKMTLSKHFKDNLTNRLKKLANLSKKIMSAHVDLSRNESHNREEKVRVEVNLRLTKKIIRAVDRNIDLKNAFDEVERKLKQQLRKYKEFSKIKRRKLIKIVRQSKTIEE